MRPSGISVVTFLERAWALTVFVTGIGCFTVLVIHRLSDNDPRKKFGNKWKEEQSEMDARFDWERCKLEFVHVLNGVKIGGKYVFVPKPGAQTLEDYLREKEARFRAEQSEKEEKARLQAERSEEQKAFRTFEARLRAERSKESGTN